MPAPAAIAPHPEGVDLPSAPSGCVCTARERQHVVDRLDAVDEKLDQLIASANNTGVVILTTAAKLDVVSALAARITAALDRVRQAVARLRPRRR